jgi:hypothetical protein
LERLSATRCVRLESAPGSAPPKRLKERSST